MREISFSMSSGVEFFNPGFSGTADEALRWIVDNQLSPSPLGRAAWAEHALQTAVRTGTTQYLIVAAGYDTFAYRRPAWAEKLQLFELDQPCMSEDKQGRIHRICGENMDGEAIGSGKPDNLTYISIDLTRESLSEKLRSCNIYHEKELSFCSLLGISYYLSKSDFGALIQSAADSVSGGSTIVFDYPDEYAYTEQAGDRAKKQAMMAGGAGETMLASYSYKEMEQLLADCGFLIYEHLTPAEMTERFFAGYNKANPRHPMTAFDNTNYCLAVKRIKDAE